MVKRTICKFWEQVRRRAGESALIWRYSDTTVTTRFFFAKEMVLRILRTAWEMTFGKTGWTELYWPALRATQGTCTRGAECTWAHGEEDRGVLVPRGPGVQIAGKCRSVSLCMEDA